MNLVVIFTGINFLKKFPREMMATLSGFPEHLKNIWKHHFFFLQIMIHARNTIEMKLNIIPSKKLDSLKQFPIFPIAVSISFLWSSKIGWYLVPKVAFPVALNWQSSLMIPLNIDAVSDSSDCEAGIICQKSLEHQLLLDIELEVWLKKKKLLTTKHKNAVTIATERKFILTCFLVLPKTIWFSYFLQYIYISFELNDIGIKKKTFRNCAFL